MAKAIVEAGICGFITSIEAVPEKKGKVMLSLETNCPSLKPLAEELKVVDGMKECFAPVGDSPVFHLARKYCKHAACPVPTAIVKTIEVACSLALPKDVKITITK